MAPEAGRLLCTANSQVHMRYFLLEPFTPTPVVVPPAVACTSVHLASSNVSFGCLASKCSFMFLSDGACSPQMEHLNLA